MAIRVLDRVIDKIGGSTTWSRCRTHRLSIGGTNEAVAEDLAYWVKRYPRLAWYFRILYQRYGLDAHTICQEAMAIHKGLDPDPRAEPIRAEVRYVCRNEMVCTLEDLLERRAGFLYWSSEQRLERARYGARVIRGELALTEKEFEDQFARYREHLTRFHSLPGSVP
jgi:glycerol-3-phosphate dehydrogenase